MNIDPATLDTSGISKYVASGASQSTHRLLHEYYSEYCCGCFAEGEILQVLLFAFYLVLRYINWVMQVNLY